MNKVYTLLILFYLIPLASHSQRLMDRNGYMHFFSEAPLENIEADNKQVLGVLDMSTGKVAVSVLMKGFHFKKSLMEEHFNENYVESDKYPKATFSGLLADFNKEKLLNSSDTINFVTSGELTIHGVTKPLETSVSLFKENNQINVITQFVVAVEDHEIEVPTLLISNIAEEVLVTGKFSFKLEE